MGIESRLFGPRNEGHGNAPSTYTHIVERSYSAVKELKKSWETPLGSPRDLKCWGLAPGTQWMRWSGGSGILITEAQAAELLPAWPLLTTEEGRLNWGATGEAPGRCPAQLHEVL